MFDAFPINYDTPVFRPPSEGRSLLIQVTIGCSNNKCTYCDMYRSKTYRERTFKQIEQDIIKAKEFFSRLGPAHSPRRAFLCDGDALGAPTDLLTAVLDSINQHFPEIERIGIYATAENILEKSDDELELLRQKKLSIAYLGMESGSDKVLHLIVKGNNKGDMQNASLKIKKAKIKLSVIVMLGVGGKKLSKEHSEQTGEVINITRPEYLGMLVTNPVANTPYHRLVARGGLQLLTAKEHLEEMRAIVESIKGDLEKPVIFRANHVSNFAPIGGILPKDSSKILEILDSWIAKTPNDLMPPLPDQM